MSGKMMLAGLLLTAGLTLGGTAPTAQATGTDDRHPEVHACVAIDSGDDFSPVPGNSGCNGGCGNNGSCKPK